MRKALSGILSVATVAALLVWLPASSARADDPQPGRRSLYLASRDEIRSVLRVRDGIPPSKGGTFIGIVGGLAALNFIERLQPSEILLVDLSPEQVEYGRCVIELIKQSPDRTAFVSAFFSRPFLPGESEFLAQPGDAAMLRSSVEKIEDSGLRESCATDLALIVKATYEPATRSLRIRRNSNGSRLRLRGPPRGMLIGFNYLYFDQGWLESDQSYLRTRAALRAARIHFLASDIGAVPMKYLRGREIVFWGTNLATWYRQGKEAYERFVIRAHEELASRNEAIRFVFTSTYRQPAWTDFLPFQELHPGVHLDASAKVRKHAEGKRVLELVPGKAYFGRELRARKLVVHNARKPIPAKGFDVAVLHLLNNSGIRWWRTDRAQEFRALYEKVLKRASEIVVLEHNRRSVDFSEARRARMVGMAELLQPLFGVLATRRLKLAFEPAIGKTDKTRNFVLHVKKL